MNLSYDYLTEYLNNFNTQAEQLQVLRELHAVAEPHDMISILRVTQDLNI